MGDDVGVRAIAWSGVDQLASAANLPWLLPGVAVALVVSLAACRPVARWLDVPNFVAWVLVMSVGVILTATVTPQALKSDATTGRSCEFARLRPPGLYELTASSDVLGNILMFIPLGLAIGVAPWSTRTAGLLGAAIALPFLIEATQLVVSPLGRGCQSADVIDNLAGLVLGLAAGVLSVRLAPDLVRRRDHNS